MVVSILAGIGFSALLVTVSYGLYHRLLGPDQPIRYYDLALTAAAVFLLAILSEIVVNAVYQWFVGALLWEYRVLPLHDRSVSALGVLIWPAFGCHVYLIQRVQNHRLPRLLRNTFGKALILGLEAPLVWEVAGNLYFLGTIGQYYAYYNPSDLWHLTSIQVVPIYIVTIYAGLLVLHALQRMGRHRALPAVLFLAGIGLVVLG